MASSASSALASMSNAQRVEWLRGYKLQREKEAQMKKAQKQASQLVARAPNTAEEYKVRAAEAKNERAANEEADGGTEDVQDIDFIPYAPKKLQIGIPHPDGVVENGSLSSVAPPDIDPVAHALQLATDHPDIVSQGKLSDLQLEAVTCVLLLLYLLRPPPRLRPPVYYTTNYYTTPPLLLTTHISALQVRDDAARGAAPGRPPRRVLPGRRRRDGQGPAARGDGRRAAVPPLPQARVDFRLERPQGACATPPPPTTTAAAAATAAPVDS